MTALAGEPLPVEFCHGGSWHSAVLVGWRPTPDGSCLLRVRFVVGGLRRTGWMPLTDVRLPEPQPVSWVPSVPRPRRPDDHLGTASPTPPRMPG